MNLYCVYMSIDEPYLPFVATTVFSILERTSIPISFNILHSGVSISNQQKMRNWIESISSSTVAFHEINLEKHFGSFITLRHLTKSMYGRFLIPYLHTSDNQLALYTDVDVLFRCDIKELFSADLEGYPLGAVWEDFHSNSNGKDSKYSQLNLRSSHKYFNSGLMLINCPLWKKLDVLNQIKVIETKYRAKLTCPDQDLLNILFMNNYKALPERYSVLNQRLKNHTCTHFFHQFMIDTKIRHFNGETKPWNIRPSIFERNKHVGTLDFWRVAEKTPYFNQIKEAGPSFSMRYFHFMLRLSNLRLTLVKKIDKRI